MSRRAKGIGLRTHGYMKKITSTYIRVQNRLRHLDAVAVFVERVPTGGTLHHHQPEAPDVAHVGVGRVVNPLWGHVSDELHELHESHESRVGYEYGYGYRHRHMYGMGMDTIRAGIGGGVRCSQLISIPVYQYCSNSNSDFGV